MIAPQFVIPAKAEIHHRSSQGRAVISWVPAFAGMTIVGALNLVQHG